MKKKLIWLGFVCFVIVAFIVLVAMAGKLQKLPFGIQDTYNDYSQDQSLEVSENQSLDHYFSGQCTEYFDFSEDITSKEGEAIMSTLKTTGDIDMLRKYACSLNTGWRAYIAGNKNTPEDILSFYSDDNDWLVRNYLGSNQSLPLILQEKLSNDGKEQVLLSLARNPKVEESVLMKILKNSPSASTEESLGFNRGTSNEFKILLAQELTSPNALKALRNNPTTGEDVFELLDKRSEE